MREKYSPFHSLSDPPKREDLDRTQNRIQEMLDRLYKADPSLDCLYLEDVALVTGANQIEHKLGRTMRGWQVVRDDARPVFVRAYHNAVGGAQTLVAATVTKVKLDVKVADWGNDFDVSNYIFTTPHAGIYYVDGSVTLGTVADTVQMVSWLGINPGGERNLGGHKQGGASLATQATGVVWFVAKAVQMSLWTYVSSGTPSVYTGEDETRMVVRSDESLTEAPSTDASKYLNLYSARSRTVTLKVW